jgi:fructose-1,6-bisphosphatase/inositol monophosphatase family enzyme
VTAQDVLDLFAAAADAQAVALEPLEGADRRARTERVGQYALDLVADEAVLGVLAPAGFAILSEESGHSGPPDAAVTVVVDPVDGSTNCARGIPYWAISLCALDADGPWCALVANQATGQRFTAVRGEGAWCDGRPVQPSAVTRAEDSVVLLAGMPARTLPWKQFRALGSGALSLCDVADGRVDGFIDAYGMHAPWDYLGGWLVCLEAGAVVVDAQGRDLLTTDPDARRAMLAASTPELLEALRTALP